MVIQYTAIVSCFVGLELCSAINCNAISSLMVIIVIVMLMGAVIVRTIDGVGINHIGTTIRHSYYH